MAYLLEPLSLGKEIKSGQAAHLLVELTDPREGSRFKYQAATGETVTMWRW
jgi:hypothetical protein